MGAAAGRDARSSEAGGYDAVDELTVEAATQGAAERETARPLVYLVVGVGIVVALLGMVFSQGAAFSLATPAYAVLAAIPYLTWAALSLRQPGAEAVVGGVLLLGVGSWGYLGLPDGDDSALVLLPAYLTMMVGAIFVLGAALRATVGRRR
jgi:hypothetical protein